MRYKLVPESEVDLWQRRLAKEAVAVACRVLKIQTPAIKFFRSVTEFEGNFGTFEMSADHLFGYTNGVEIFFRRNLSDRDLMTTAIHESRHVWQYKSADWRNRSTAVRERDAKIFELGWPRTDSETFAFKKLYMTG
jgi:hypothetical protein